MSNAKHSNLRVITAQPSGRQVVRDDDGIVVQAQSGKISHSVQSILRKDSPCTRCGMKPRKALSSGLNSWGHFDRITTDILPPCNGGVR